MTEKRARWLHEVLDFHIDLIGPDNLAQLTFRTGDEADHSFVLDRAALARLAAECVRLTSS